MKTARLTLLTLRRSLARVVLLSLLVALGMTVLSVVAELSRQSTEGLGSAIEQDVGGATGTYRFTFTPSGLGLSPSELTAAVRGSVRGLLAAAPVIIENIPAQTPECPPFEQLGAVPVRVVYDAGLRPVALPFGQNLPAGTQFCIAGMRLPADTIYVPTDAQQRQWQFGLAVRPEVAAAAALNTTGPITWSYLLVTGSADSLGDVLAQHLTDTLEPYAQRNGVDLDDAMSFVRVDQGSSIRAASEGITLVYQVIGWGVLALSAIGILVSQVILVGQRMWFFGLTRALGARSTQIVGMVLCEVAAVAVIGVVLAVLALLALQPAAAALARSAFNVDAQLLRPGSIPLLALGALVVMAVGGTYPAMKAIRSDPGEVLEPAVG